MDVGIILTITFIAVFFVTVCICLFLFKNKIVDKKTARSFRENNAVSPDNNEPLSNLQYNETLKLGIEKRKQHGFKMVNDNEQWI